MHEFQPGDRVVIAKCNTYELEGLLGVVMSQTAYPGQFKVRLAPGFDPDIVSAEPYFPGSCLKLAEVYFQEENARLKAELEKETFSSDRQQRELDEERGINKGLLTAATQQEEYISGLVKGVHSRNEIIRSLRSQVKFLEDRLQDARQEPVHQDTEITHVMGDNNVAYELVIIDGEVISCGCPDWKYRPASRPCKHAVRYECAHASPPSIRSYQEVALNKIRDILDEL